MDMGIGAEAQHTTRDSCVPTWCHSHPLLMCSAKDAVEDAEPGSSSVRGASARRGRDSNVTLC